MEQKTIERKVLDLIARDRLEIPLSSMYQKIKRVKKKDAEGLADILYQGELQGEFESNRVFAFLADEDNEKARGMKEAVAEFSTEFPKYGTILAGKIAEKRTLTEKHLYFGTNTGSRLTTDDYIAVMQSTGMSELTSRALYPELLKVSRKLEKEREEDRAVIVGKYEESDSD